MMCDDDDDDDDDEEGEKGDVNEDREEKDDDEITSNDISNNKEVIDVEESADESHESNVNVQINSQTNTVVEEEVEELEQDVVVFSDLNINDEDGHDNDVILEKEFSTSQSSKNHQKDSEIESDEKSSDDGDSIIIVADEIEKEETKEKQDTAITVDSNEGNEENKSIYFAELAELKEALENQKQLVADAQKETVAASKETRKLRRTVVKINAELDSAERELDAQRTELERAATRMEKERQRYKEDKERLEKSHKEDMKSVMEEHKISIDSMMTSHAEQIIDMEERIKRADDARAKEGGDMSMELADACEREREAVKKVMALEEEKSTLASQVASLNTQMGASQSRVESLQHAVEVSSEQERDTDDRLDAALSLHARQIAQRQAREAKLERTIADLGAALVVARQRETQAMNGIAKYSPANDDGDNILQLKEKLASTEDEIEVQKVQIINEIQKAEALQKELKDIYQERTQEMSASLSREKIYDQRVADLNGKVSQLESRLRNLVHSDDDNEVSSENPTILHFQEKEKEYQKQISSLTDDLLKQRGRLENASTEVLTLRNRLRTALTRAENSEKEAHAAIAVEANYDIERGQVGRSNGVKVRRRFGGRIKKTASIRSAFKIDSNDGEVRQAIGGAIDSMDKVSMQTVNYLRVDPVGRAFFILYLIVLHLWTFCLLAFHAHGTLEPSSNVGPEQLLKHSYRHNEQVHGPA